MASSTRPHNTIDGHTHRGCSGCASDMRGWAPRRTPLEARNCVVSGWPVENPGTVSVTPAKLAPSCRSCTCAFGARFEAVSTTSGGVLLFLVRKFVPLTTFSPQSYIIRPPLVNPPKVLRLFRHVPFHGPTHVPATLHFSPAPSEFDEDSIVIPSADPVAAAQSPVDESSNTHSFFQLTYPRLKFWNPSATGGTPPKLIQRDYTFSKGQGDG